MTNFITGTSDLKQKTMFLGESGRSEKNKINQTIQSEIDQKKLVSKKKGRKPKAPRLHLVEPILIRITKDQQDFLHHQSEILGVPMAGLIRQSIRLYQENFSKSKSRFLFSTNQHENQQIQET
ncbi:MAG: hypothetical protein RL065_821 [Bacteroidota bacterium]|jgi:hypothetical protein